MASTVSQGFQELRSNLEITDIQTTTVSTRQQNVRNAIVAGLEVHEDFLTGSYMRSTMVCPLSLADVDIFVVLNRRYWQENGQALLLETVKQTLLRTYSQTPDISGNGQAVTVTFSDFKVDVVPAFYRNGGGYLIPDSKPQRWIETDPKTHIVVWSNANRIHGGNLIPLIKMLKAWNRANHEVFSSFHLETLTLQILTGVTITDFSSGVRYVLDKPRSMFLLNLPDPAGMPETVGGGFNTTETLLLNGTLENSYRLAVEAESLDGAGRTIEAFERWRRIFGGYFPAYG